MRLAQLHEAQEALHQSVEEQIELIKRECSDIVGNYQRTNIVLLRGEEIRCRSFESDIRTGRKPKQMKRRWHGALEDAFNIAGLDVTRSNSIFCSTNFSTASNWGEVYVIFPKNVWRGLVFEDVKTGYVYHRLEKILPQTEIRIPAGDNRTVPGTDPELLAHELQKLQPKLFTTKTADPILTARYEDILIKGRGYIAVRNSYSTSSELSDISQILAGLGIDAHNLGKHWENHNGISVDEWKAKILKRYPKADIEETMPDHFEAKLGNKFVGLGWFPGKRSGSWITQVFLHPRDTDY